MIITKTTHETIPLLEVRSSPSCNPETGDFSIEEADLIQKIHMLCVELLLTVGAYLGNKDCVLLKTLIDAEKAITTYENLRLSNAPVQDKVIQEGRKKLFNALRPFFDGEVKKDLAALSLSDALKEYRFTQSENAQKEATSDLNRTVHAIVQKKDGELVLDVTSAITLRSTLESANNSFIHTLKTLRTTIRNCSTLSSCMNYLSSTEKVFLSKIHAVVLASENLYSSLKASI